MNYLFKILILLSSLLSACCQNSHIDNQHILQKRIDSLEKNLAGTYKPGFGEFMSSVQVHHAKLWFAGQNKNWKLADFEVHEIMEALTNIKKYQTERKESQLVDMLDSSLYNVNNAIQKQNSELFKNSFVLLTNSCNNCHKETNFDFNIVKIPDTEPFSNQVFKNE